MSHLGRWLSALVDGELDGAERDRVLNHLARCQPCRQEANALRALKRRMTALGDNSADTAIAGRLMDLARSDSDLVGRPARSRWSATRPAPPVTGPAWGRYQFRPGWMLAAGSAGLAVTAIGAVAFMLGGAQPAPAPRITPAVEVYWQQHGYDTGQVPAARPGSAGGSGSGPASAGAPSASPASAAGPSEPPGSAGSLSASPGSAGSPSARPGWASTPSARPGPAGGPSDPSAVLRHSP